MEFRIAFHSGARYIENYWGSRNGSCNVVRLSFPRPEKQDIFKFFDFYLALNIRSESGRKFKKIHFFK